MSTKPGAGHIVDIVRNEIKPWRGSGNDALRNLHDLDIADKHTLIVPSTHQVSVEKAEWTAGNFSGLKFEGVKHPMIIIGRGAPPPGTIKMGKSVVFGEYLPYAGEEIIPILDHLAHLVTGIVQTFETHVTGHK